MDGLVPETVFRVTMRCPSPNSVCLYFHSFPANTNQAIHPTLNR
jgi:hypothetical protein